MTSTSDEHEDLDHDLRTLREELESAARRLRAAIRAHRDASGHEL